MLAGAAVWAWTHPDAALVQVSIPAWCLVLACLAPAAWRLMRRRTRYLDALWGVVGMLALNRLGLLFHISREVSHASGAALAFALAWMVVSYQRLDRTLER